MPRNVESGPGGQEPGINPNFESSDFHERLGVPKGASPEDISSAYRDAAKKTHPDMGGDVKDFKRVQEAFEGLNNPQKESEHPRVNQRNSPEWGPMPPINMHEKTRDSNNDPSGVIKLWKMIDEATVKLDRGEELSNIDEVRILEKTIERYINSPMAVVESDKEMAESALDEIRSVINRHEVLAAKKEFVQADQKPTEEKKDEKITEQNKEDPLDKELNDLFRAQEEVLKNNKWKNDGVFKKAWHKLVSLYENRPDVYDQDVDYVTAWRLNNIDVQINQLLLKKLPTLMNTQDRIARLGNELYDQSRTWTVGGLESAERQMAILRKKEEEEIRRE